MNRKKLVICFVFSVCMHITLLLCVQRYSIWFSAKAVQAPSVQWLSLIDKNERDQILKTTFDPLNLNEKEAPLSPQPEKAISKMNFKITPQPIAIEEFKFSSSESELSIQTSLLAPPISTTFPLHYQSFNLLEHLPKDLIIPAPHLPHQPLFLPLPNELSLNMKLETPTLKEQSSLPSIVYSEHGPLVLPEANLVKKAPPLVSLPHLPKFPTLEELETSSYSDSFDVDLFFTPLENGKGYIFALTLIPLPDLSLPKLDQHITFLIDRSNSIQQGRLSNTKAAIHKALAELSSADTFNIIAFDSKMEKMAPINLPCSEKSYAVAEAFLEKIQLGSFFSNTDLSKPLFLTVPSQVEANEIHTAILLTDGENLGKKNAQRSLLKDWTNYNAGKVSLFAIGMNDAHMATLETAAIFNRGKAINAPSNRGLKRKLLKLVKNIQNPIAKNLSCHAISKSPHKILLYPKHAQSPHLYVDQPYVILGETETLDDFILFVQGRLKDRWLNVKKTVSFLEARKGTKTLKEEWALQKIYDLYEQYIIDEDPKHLADAQTFLKPFDLPTIDLFR